MVRIVSPGAVPDTVSAHRQQGACLADLAYIAPLTGSADPQVGQREVVTDRILGVQAAQGLGNLKGGSPGAVGTIRESDESGEMEHMRVQRNDQTGWGDGPESQVDACGSLRWKPTHPSKEHAHSLASGASRGSTQKAHKASLAVSLRGQVQSLALVLGQSMELAESSLKHASDIRSSGIDVSLEESTESSMLPLLLLGSSS